MNSSERSQPRWDPQQITLIMLNRFWSLNKKPFTSLFLAGNIKLDGMPTKSKLKTQACFTLYFKCWEGTLKSYKIQLPVLSCFVSYRFLYQQIATFYNFLELHWRLSEKDFVANFPCLMVHPNPPPLNNQNLLSVTKVFCQFSVKCLLNFFLKYFCWQNSEKPFFMYQQWTATVHYIYL